MRLITFGDSWVYGVGAEYQDGMSDKEYIEIAQSESKNCFRQLISSKLGLDNVNLSEGGSSNQAQFRLALETFFGKDKLKWAASDIVLWGITSVYRTELWNTEKSAFKTITLPLDPKNPLIAKIIGIHHHSEEEELKILGNQMNMWNSYFKANNIKNYWFNLFNDHSWDINIDNFLFKDSSLLSLMINDNKINDKYHKSVWHFTDRKIKIAKEMKLVNPISGHPTKKGHEIIADILMKEIK